jgi:hypothetical protein
LAKEPSPTNNEQRTTPTARTARTARITATNAQQQQQPPTPPTPPPKQQEGKRQGLGTTKGIIIITITTTVSVILTCW